MKERIMNGNSAFKNDDEYLVHPVTNAMPATNAIPASPDVQPTEIPEWDQEVPPPPIAQAVPDKVVDAAEYRANVRRGETSNLQVQQPQAPMESQTPQYGIETPRLTHSANSPHSANYPHAAGSYAAGASHNSGQPSRSNLVAGSQYSPFRDDENAYHDIIEHRGIKYYIRELNDKAKKYVATFPRRFINNPRHRIVEAVDVIPPRPIALEEVVGGKIQYYGEVLNVEQGHIYTEFPELHGHLTVRHIRVDELSLMGAIMEEHPELIEKMRDAQEELWTQVIANSLVGWSLNAEVSYSNVCRLHLEVKRLLFKRIGASSEFGLGEDEFFRPGR